MLKSLRHGIVKQIAPKMYQEWIALQFNVRPFTTYLSTLKKAGLVGVEIGVLEGCHALGMMQNLNMFQLYLVDPYEPYVTSMGDHFDPTYAKHLAHQRLNKYSNRITWIYNLSRIAYEQIPNKLDFVYIDGSHKYEDVLKDIYDYHEKVKVGGYVAGHDFCAKEVGVTNAVLEAATQLNVELHGASSDWWFIKK